MNQPLIILSGPTAVGKTELSISLAKAIHGEIISADSMQVYKYMDIGTAKIKPDVMDGVKHHLIDFLEPDEEYNVVRFLDNAKEAIKKIYTNGSIPIITGGTGFYIQAVLYDIDFFSEDNSKEYRKSLECILSERGAEYLHSMLMEVDPNAASIIHVNNIKRVIRALEYNHKTGGLISNHNETQKIKNSPYNYAYFVLTNDRKVLYDAIDNRVDVMIEEGLLNEVKGLRENGYHKDLISMQGLGYKELYAYLEGEIDFDEAVRILKRDTRHFAKRQLTWLKREKEAIWFDKSSDKKEEDIIYEMLNELRKRKIVL